MPSSRALQVAAPAVFFVLIVGLGVAHLLTSFNAAEWQAVGTIIGATAAAPTLLLLASQIAMATDERREARLPVLVPDLQHVDAKKPGANVYFTLRNIGGGAGQKVRMHFDPPLPTSDDASREFAKFVETGVSIMPPGKEVQTTFIFGAVKTSPYAAEYRITIECLDVHGDKVVSPVYVLGVEELRLLTSISSSKSG